MSSVSMESKQDHQDVPPKYEEAWFDVANPCGKEFELPNISCPMSNPNNFLFSQLDVPAMPESAFVLDIMSNLSSDGNHDLAYSSPILEMVPPMNNINVPVVNFPKETTLCSSGNLPVDHYQVKSSFAPIVNHQIHFSRFTGLLDFGGGTASFPLKNQLVHVPNSSCFSRDGLDIINFSLSNNRQFVHAGSNNHIPAISQTSHVRIPSKTSMFPSNNCIMNINDLVHFPNSRWPYLSVMSNGYGNSFGQSYLENNLNHLQNCGHRTRTMRSTLSFTWRNLLESPTPKWDPQTFGPSSFQVLPTSSDAARKIYDLKYICKDCGKGFSSYSSFGGHMSFHARTRKMYAKFSSRIAASQHKENTDEKMDGNSSRKMKAAMEKRFSASENEIVKKSCHQLQERSSSVCQGLEEMTLPEM
ncbi:hypothetical protein I3760_14G120400 [Carya illinoinensis]|nr:hypothetical protein I3760_14G120400 [Carya illinoinensis]